MKKSYQFEILKSVLLYFVIKVIFILVYKYQIVRVFEYEGYKLSVNVLNMIIENFAYCIVVILIHKYINDVFYKTALNIIIVLFLIPNGVMFSMMSTDYRIILSSYMFVVAIMVVSMFKKKFVFPKLRYEQRMGLLLVLCVIAMLYALFVIRNNINFKVLIFSDIYKTRAESLDVASGIGGYILSWGSSTIFPIALLYGLVKKKNILIFISFIGMLYLYMSSGHKSIFLSIFIYMYFYFIGKKKYNYSALNLHITFFIMMCWLIDYISRFNILVSMFARRVFFVPALLNTFYFDYFDNNYLYWKFSLFKMFNEDYEYVHIPRLIGQIYFNQDEMGANNGILSDGFMNFGMLGVIINIIIVALIIKIISDLKLPRTLFGVLFKILFVLLSSFLFTSLITHGILLLVMMLILFFNNTDISYGQKYDKVKERKHV